MKTFILSLILLYCPTAEAGQQTVSFTTKDGCKLEAFYSAPSSGALVFINVHGLGSDKNEWGGWQGELAARGYGWLSIDLRGHGASVSCGGKKADYRNFTRVDWGKASRDIEAAAGWLKKKKISDIVFCGASVGANLALKAAAEGATKPAGVVLLSPGMDYAGITPELYLAKAPKRLLFAAASDDPYAWQSAAALSRLAAKSGLTPSAIDGGLGHGVNMFKSPGTSSKVLDWAGKLSARVGAPGQK